MGVSGEGSGEAGETARRGLSLWATSSGNLTQKWVRAQGTSFTST